MMARPVTNTQFAEFVDATAYLTVAERPVNPADYPDAPAEQPATGLDGFTRTQGPVDLRHLNLWWTWTPGASWRHPVGPLSSIDKRVRSPGRACRVRGRRSRTRRGPACPFRRRRNGRPPPAAVSPCGGTRGATSRSARANLWPTTGTATSRGGLPRGTDARACRQLPAQRLRAVRHGRQRVGVDHRLVRRHPRQPTLLRLQTVTTHGSHSSKCRARWSRAARFCARTSTACGTALPPSPAAGRHRHEPRRLPLRQALATVRGDPLPTAPHSVLDRAEHSCRCRDDPVLADEVDDAAALQHRFGLRAHAGDDQPAAVALQIGRPLRERIDDLDDGTSGSAAMDSTTTALRESATFGHSSSILGTSANSPTPA